MIDFEEELKKFHPSLEVDEAEEAIKHHDMTDLTDIMLELYRQAGEAESETAPASARRRRAASPEPEQKEEKE